MKTILKMVTSLVCLIAMTGCIGLAKTVEQLKGDNASFAVDLNTLYGHLNIVRSMPGATNQVIVVTNTTRFIQVPTPSFPPVPPQTSK